MRKFTYKIIMDWYSIELKRKIKENNKIIHVSVHSVISFIQFIEREKRDKNGFWSHNFDENHKVLDGS